ncbi:MAG: 16S rRNA (cytosine(967)-C(5))-methyltransferase RsmB [Clostridiaceae bacterium]|nr:16S rRNA (cytosine(967)-C(5))-methyltransferase RsmB [Clostridiaceae bacterium]
MKLDHARETALKILFEINEKGAYSNIELNKQLSGSELGEMDRGFITEIVYGVVKRKLTLDRLVAAHSNIRMSKLSPWILNILRLGAYQLLYMSRVPASAACNESVKLAGRYGHKASSGFVNAILRKIAREGMDNIIPDKETDLPGYLSVKHSYPSWLTQKYIELFGEEFAEALLEAGNRIPELTIRANTLRVSAEELKTQLEKEGVWAEYGRFIREALVIKSPLPVGRLDSFKKGLFQVQDESSMLPAMVLAPESGDVVLDACSAPGGKAVNMAQIMKNSGRVIARDIHEHKLRLIDEAASRLGTSIVESELYDAGIPDPTHEAYFDRVLLDAPCSGLGIVRRKPDIKWARESSDIGSIATLQGKLLQNVSKAVKPGGILVYSTCTILPEENECIVRNFIESNREFCEDDISPYLPPALAPYARGSMLQVYPNRDGIDGFFIARLKRKADLH